MYYILIGIATILFSLQFIFNKRYQQDEGTAAEKVMLFVFLQSVAIALLMFFLNGCRIECTVFSFLISFWSAVNNILFALFGIYVLSVANVPLYALFSMLGGMLLPFLFGICVFNEPLTFAKIICCLLIFWALTLGTTQDRKPKRYYLYYFAIFFLNGLSGVIAKIHQNFTDWNISSTGFTLMSAVASLCISGILLLLFKKRGGKISFFSPKKSIFNSVFYGIFTGVGNLLLLISLNHVQASIQYPFITGGTIMLSLLISVFLKEKIQKRDILSALIACFATVIIV